MNTNHFSNILKGTHTYINLINELSKIHNLNDFYVVVSHCKYDYLFINLYDLNLNELKYPNNFSKTIFDAEPEVDIYYNNKEFGDEAFTLECSKRDDSGYLCYRVSIDSRFINISNSYETIKEINKNNNSDYDLKLTNENIHYNQYFNIVYDKLNDSYEVSCGYK